MITYIIDQLAFISTHFIGNYGYFAVVVLMALESVNIPIPSEIIMPFAGFLVTKGDLNLFWVVIAGVFGNWLGSALSYYLGAYGGRPLVDKYGKYIRMKHHHLDMAENWFNKYGEFSVFFGRMLPIVRTFISFPAGLARMNFTKFSIYTILGAFPFCYLLAWLGFKMGENWEDLRKYFHYADYVVIVGIVVLIGYYLIRRKRSKSQVLCPK